MPYDYTTLSLFMPENLLRLSFFPVKNLRRKGNASNLGDGGGGGGINRVGETWVSHCNSRTEKNKRGIAANFLPI